MARNDIEMRVVADARGVATGLRPAIDSLEKMQTSAKDADKALDSIDVSINDQAIDEARKEIERLRESIRKDLTTDVNADTTQAQRRIKELQRNIRVLDTKEAKVDVKVDVDDSELVGLTAAGGAFSGFGDVLDKITLLRAGVAGGIALVGGQLVNLSADAETARVSLATLAGGVEEGAKAFEMLNDFASNTPYQFDQINDAAKILLGMGVPLQDLQDTLVVMGDTSSAFGQDIGEVSLIYGQMLAKGKASNEELLQLTERGIAGYQLLADALGITVAEVQKLAEENKLGVEAVQLLRIEMERTYGGSMARQAETLNGKLSTMLDNVKNLGRSFGDALTPAAEDAVDAVSKLVVGIDKLVQKNAEFQRQIESADASVWEQMLSGMTATGFEFFDFFKGKLSGLESPVPLWLQDMSEGIEEVADSTETAEEKTKRLKDEAQRLADAIKTGFRDYAAEVKVWQQQMDAATDAVGDSIQAFSDIGVDVRTKVSFIMDSADLEDEIHKAIAGTPGSKTEEGVPAVSLPANLNIHQLTGLTDAQQQLIGMIGSGVEQGLAEGARRAEVVPNFNEDVWLKNLREKTKGQLIDAGIDTDEAERVLTNVFGLPRQVPVEADISYFEKQLRAVERMEPVQVPAVLNFAMNAAEWTGPGGAPGGDILKQILTGPEFTGTPVAGGPRRPKELAPKQSPNINVFVDGKQVASYVDPSIRRLQGTGRRRP